MLIKCDCNISIPLLIPIIIVILAFKLKEHYEGTLEEKTLFIGILSARENVQQRNTFRELSIKYLNHKNVQYKFFVGAKCIIPLEDRLSEFSCIEVKNNITNQINVSEAFEDIKCVNGRPNSDCYTGFGFQVHHAITLHSIGVQKQLFEYNESLLVTLRDAEEVWEQILINKTMCFDVNGFCYISINPLLLPKRFEGEVSLSTDNQFMYTNESCLWQENECLHLTFGRTKDGLEKYKTSKCSFLHMNFTVLDISGLKEHTKTRQERFSKWRKQNTETELQIDKEIKAFGDVVFLPQVIDVYQHLTTKLIKMIRWTHEHYFGIPLLKIDDDHFFNTSMLLSMLHEATQSLNELCVLAKWHRWRQPDIFGKHAVFNYDGISYPAFPSGAGYLLSGPLVTLLAEVAPHLRHFPCEDVSMGIWTQVLSLDGKLVQKIEPNCWLPEGNCDHSYLLTDVTSEG